MLYTCAGKLCEKTGREEKKAMAILKLDDEGKRNRCIARHGMFVVWLICIKSPLVVGSTARDETARHAAAKRKKEEPSFIYNR